MIKVGTALHVRAISALIQLPHTLSELTGPLYGHNPIGETDNDLTRQHTGEPLGERIVVAGRVVDQGGPGPADQKHDPRPLWFEMTPP